jgi:hypothetical protein
MPLSAKKRRKYERHAELPGYFRAVGTEQTQPLIGVACDWLERKVRGLDRKKRLHTFFLHNDAELKSQFGQARPWRHNLKQPRTGKRGRIWWYKATAKFDPRLQFPAEIELPVGTRPMTDTERTLAELEGKTFIFRVEETVMVTVKDALEMGVLVGAMPLFEYLRRTEQVEGRATKVGVNKAAIEWLEEFRRGRT